MRQSWWKILTIGLLLYTLIAGLLMDVPRLPILNETIRALHFHVTMWFGMILMLVVAVVYSIKFCVNIISSHFFYFPLRFL